MYIFCFREGNDPGDDSTITYGALLKQVCKFSNVLKSLGKLVMSNMAIKYTALENFLVFHSSGCESVCGPPPPMSPVVAHGVF